MSYLHRSAGEAMARAVAGQGGLMGPGVAPGRREFDRMSDAEVLRRAGEVLRKWNDLPMGSPERQAAKLRYETLSNELSLRSVEYALDKIGAQPGVLPDDGLSEGDASF